MHLEKNLVSIRRYAQSDFDGVKALIKELAELFGNEFDDQIFENAMGARLFAQLEDDSIITLIGEYNSEVIGTAFMNTELDPRAVLRGRISHVIVKKECEGTGCGSALVDKATDFFYLTNIVSILANVNINDPALMHLFTKRHFQPILNVMEMIITPNEELPRPCLTGEEIEYRPISEDDLPAAQTLVEKFGILCKEPFNAQRFNLNIQKFISDLNAKIFVAEKEKIVKGIVFAEVKIDPTGLPYGYISNIVIDKDLRGLGIGTNLLNLAISFLLDLRVPKIWGNSSIGNEKMQNMYEKQGFHNKFVVMNLDYCAFFPCADSCPKWEFCPYHPAR